jgi:hypothetical protein
LTGAALSFAVQQAEAAKITGSIDMTGTASLNSTFLGSASATTGFGPVTVGGLPDGTFTGTFGSSVTWNNFSWPSATSVNPLWSFSKGGVDYSFTLESVTVDTQNNKFLNLLGTGKLNATGYEQTQGTWSFTISNSTGAEHANFSFTFGNNQTAAVPDGGATAMLLGAGFLGLAGLRRKLS